MSANIHERARLMVLASHGERTLAEAYQELSRRAKNARRYGRCRVGTAKPADFAAVERARYWWQETEEVSP